MNQPVSYVFFLRGNGGLHNPPNEAGYFLEGDYKPGWVGRPNSHEGPVGKNVAPLGNAF